MDKPIVYSIKVEPTYLEGARKFFSRVTLSLQDALRAQIKMAADCEQCLLLVESKAPIGQVQSAFASILADVKETWRLNGLFQDVMLKTAQACKLPDNFITNVLAEAQRIQIAYGQSQEKGKGVKNV